VLIRAGEGDGAGRAAPPVRLVKNTPVSRSLLAAFSNRLGNLRDSFLVLPGAIALALAACAFGLTFVDRAAGGPDGLGIFPAGPDSARTVLSTIAAAIATVAAVSFSITILALQLVSQQFTPRGLRTFLGDRVIQAIAGAFVGIVLYCLVTMGAVRDDEPTFVPGLTVALGIVLAFVGLALLLVFVDHMGHSIQISTIVRRIAEGTVAQVDRLYPASYGEPAEEDAGALVRSWHENGQPTVVYPHEAGYVRTIDHIPKTIEGRSFRIELLVNPGDFVSERHPLAHVWTGGDPNACADALRRAVAVGAERDMAQDSAYGLRQLADVAIKALSPSLNDPTTATTCISYLQTILERLAERPWPAEVRRFPDREVILVMPRNPFREHLHPLVQIGRYAASDARVVAALLNAARRIAQAAEAAEFPERAQEVGGVAVEIAARALRSDGINEREREEIERILEGFPSVGASAPA
jgi:uncharacterized membrane protein